MQNPFESNWWREFSKKHHRQIVIGQFVGVFVLGLIVAWFLFGSSGDSTAEDTSVAADSGPTMWTCSMHPQIRSTKPGKCPICAMDLIPVAKSGGGMRTLAVSPEAKALMKIETAAAERRYVTHEIPMVGKVDYDETRFGYITAWVTGRLDQLYVDYTGIEVKKGDHMVYIYSEQLYSAQQELIQAVKYARPNDSPSSTPRLDLAKAAREKLRLLGLTDEQIKEIEQQEKPSDRLTIYAPMGGIVIEKLKQEGERVALGDRIYTIADLSQVWVHLDAYESDLPWIRYGQDVTVTTESYPGEEFHGRISFIQPVLNDKTRTVKVRVNVPNTDGKLKPQMFVHAVVRPKVAAGGRVMDPSLAGKWISPMHPEIIKDEPGKCDVCGMPLVRAETLGYVTPTTDEKDRPLVIPYLAALVTGTRAIVYTELPSMHSAAEPALQTLSAILEEGELDKIHEAFATYARMLDRPYDQPGTDYAKALWSKYADQLSQDALTGQRSSTVKQAEEILARIENTMTEAREYFAPAGQPTFEGREIVLGPRAGEYYLVRNGLQPGEMVVTQGNFKIDAEIQIQAKPSMMTPEGGGGGGHDHGGHGGGEKKSSGDEHAGHKMSLPAEFSEQIRELESAYEDVTKATEKADIAKAKTAFQQFGQKLAAVDGSELTGHTRMAWKEFAMLLDNDVVEGREVEQLAEADRVFLLLKRHMRRMREQLGIETDQQREIEHIEVAAEFQKELAKVWQAYLPIQQALTGDDFSKAQAALPDLEAKVAAVDEQSLTGHAVHIWKKEKSNLIKLLVDLKEAEDLNAMRTAFGPLSEEIGVLVKAFGFGDDQAVYEIYCSMAIERRGGVWYQSDDQVRNPYFGSTMLKCADRVEQITRKKPTPSHKHDSHDHSQHKESPKKP